MRTLPGHLGPVTGLAFSPDGRWLASAGWDGAVRLWDVAPGVQSDEFHTPHPRALCVAISPDGRSLAAGFRGTPGEPSGNLVLCDIGDMPGTISSAFRCTPEADIRAVAFDPTSQYLLAAGVGGVIRLGIAPVVPFVRIAPAPATDALAFSGDGGWFAHLDQLGRYGLVVIRDWPAYHRKLGDFHRPGKAAHSLAFSPHGRVLAWGLGRRVLVWDIPSGRQPLELAGHDEDVLAVAFAPDGRTVVSGGGDGRVVCWDAADGGETAAFEWQVGEVRAVAVAPDGLTAAAGGENGEIVVWDLQ